MRKFLLLFFVQFSICLSWGQTLKTEGKKIVDDTGEEVILKGMGLGGWMLMEGYMMQSSDVADTQHEFKERLVELIGETKTEEFFDSWLENHVTKKDIDSLASWGFNSVRLPMHYNLFTLPIEDEPVSGLHTWLDTGFEMVDDLLSWCAENEMYLILDLHAAPGGQGANAAISDYDPDKPSLWEDELNKEKTVALWRKLAERYKNEPWIGGYDLLNEVNWTLPGNTALRALYVAITQAIREVDTNHILFIEGNSFANDFTGLTPPWDDNMAYSFHKYWSYNDPGSIEWVLNIRDQHNVPLWMGEGGENSNVWFQEAIKLFEDHKIGWSWWPMKRIETIVGPYSIPFSDGYKKILNYWRGQGAKPSETEAYNAIMELAENTNSSNCDYQKDVHDAMIRQPHTEETKPYTKHQIPGKIHFSDFDLGRINKAYSDTNYANYSLSTGEFEAWNSGWVYRNDAVDIGTNPDSQGNGYHIGYVRKGEWANYTVTIDETANYSANVRVAAPHMGGEFHLAIDGEAVTANQVVSATGGWLSFATLEIDNILLSEGQHVLTLHIDEDVEFNIGAVSFVKKGSGEALSLVALNGNTGANNNTIEVSLNQELLPTSLTGSLNLFRLEVNGEVQNISAVTAVDLMKKTIQLTTEKTLIYTDEISLSYEGDLIQSPSGKKLASFTDLKIRNILPPLFIIPGKIEVEDYSLMVGLATETTTDTGGGSNIGYTDSGDYADYPIYVEHTGNYKVHVRFAGQFDEGQIGLYILNEDQSETELVKIKSPVTGGWQTWTTSSANLSMASGIHTLRMRVLQGGFNMNWMDFELLEINNDIDTDNDGILDEDDLCPNTIAGATVDQNGCFVFTLPIDNFTIEATGETCPDRKNGKILITASESHDYVLLINGLERPFSRAITLSGLTPGDYDFCITVVGEEFQQCFSLRLEAGTTTSGKATMLNKKVQISMESGTAPFVVYNNGKKIMETKTSDFELDVMHGDLVEVRTSVSCEGVYAKRIELFDSMIAYPNPTQGQFNISLPIANREVLIEVRTIMGSLVTRKLYDMQDGKAIINLENKPAGMYLATVLMETPVTFKIIKR